MYPHKYKYKISWGRPIYFITDGFSLKCLDISSLNNLLMKFVRMSDKNSQQKTIKEIKKILQTIGYSGF